MGIRYLIEFRFSGYAKRYIKETVRDVSRKFRVKGMRVPHITLVGPFTLKKRTWPISIFSKPVDEKGLAQDFTDIIKKYDNVSFRVSGFSRFPKTRVIYVDIEASDKLRELRFELFDRLKSYCKLTEFDHYSMDDFKFHSTISMRIPGPKFDGLWNYINRKEPPDIDQCLIRVTLLRGQRILYEYDLIQKRLLNRSQALSKAEFRRTIGMLKINL